VLRKRLFGGTTEVPGTAFTIAEIGMDEKL
jgi:hypothetical protein